MVVLEIINFVDAFARRDGEVDSGSHDRTARRGAKCILNFIDTKCVSRR